MAPNSAPTPSCPAKSLVGSRRDQRRHRPGAARASRRQGLPLRPLPRGSSLPGSGHPRHGRALRPRHGRGEGGAVRRPGNGPDPRRLRPDPQRLRRRPAQHPRRSTSTSTARTSPSTRPAAAPLTSAGVLNGGGADPANAGGVQHLPGQHSVPDHATATRSASGRSCPPRLYGGKKATKRSPAPEVPRRPHRPRRRRQHRPRRRHPAALPVPRPVAHPHDLHPRPAGRARLPGGLDLRLRPGADAAARRRTGRPRLPGLLQPRTAGPAGRPAGPGERAAARRHQRRQGADQERLLPGARRAGEQVHADDEGRQARPAGQLARPLREARRSRS